MFTKRLEFTYKLEAAGKSKATSYSATLVRPETPAEFYEMCHLFVMTIVALGLASATIEQPTSSWTTWSFPLSV